MKRPALWITFSLTAVAAFGLAFVLARRSDPVAAGGPSVAEVIADAAGGRVTNPGVPPNTNGTLDSLAQGAGVLHEGDAVRFTATGGQTVTAVEPTEILVWEMHAGLAA